MAEKPRSKAGMAAGWTKRGADRRAAQAEAGRARPAAQLAQSQSAARKRRSNPARSTPHRLAGENGSMPVSDLDPRPPPVLVTYEDIGQLALFDADERDAAAPVYGQYPRGLITKALPWLNCQRHQILHVCSGSLPPGEGTRVDVRPEAKPDILADGRHMPMIADGSIVAVLIDPPYSPHYARELYGVEYPRPCELLREAARVVRPAGRVGIVHYITPRPVPGLRFVRAFGVSTGFDMPMRAITFYERDHGLVLPGQETT